VVSDGEAVKSKVVFETGAIDSKSEFIVEVVKYNLFL
jgi:hypothetical protein